MRLIEFRGTAYDVTVSTDYDLYGHIVEFRRMDDPSAKVLVRVTGWGDLGDDGAVQVTAEPGLDPDFLDFAVSHAKGHIGWDEDDELPQVWDAAVSLCDAYAGTHANAAFSASLLRNLRSRWESRVLVTTSHFDLLFTRPGHRPLAGQPGEEVHVRLLKSDTVEMSLTRTVPRRGEARPAGPVTVTGDFTRPENAPPAVEALLLQLAD